MEYPLIISGREQGQLNVERQGLFTVFEALCPQQDRLLKISVYGEGKEGYLGLMQPWSGGLYLRRSLSRTQLRSFPEKIEYAAPAGLVQESAVHKPLENEKTKSLEPVPESIDGSDLTWFRRTDGSLVSHDGKSCIVALPSALRENVPRAVIKYIDGQAYMLFRY